MYKALGCVAVFSLVVALGGCATRAVTKAGCATSNTGPEVDATFAALQRFHPDPKGHRVILISRESDRKGNEVKVMSIWPLSGPQEPAPGETVRLVLKPCTYELVEVKKVER